MMKAIRIHEFGESEVLVHEEVPEPEPEAGEVKVRVIAAGVNPADWKLRRGYMKPPLPVTPGLDIAGIVEAVGPEVGDFQPGDEVFGRVKPEHGGYAELTIAKASEIAHKPRTIGFVEAAAVPTPGLTAWQALFDIAGLEAGQTVLIHGAAGGVGTFAVQFANWRGAHVIGTASKDHADYARDLGADRMIDYREERFEEVVHDVDVVLDTVGEDTFERSWQVLKPGGVLVTLVARVPEGEAERRGVRAVHVAVKSDGSELARIATLIDEGQVRPIVTEVLPLSEARRAHEMSEARHVAGKLVLRVAEEREVRKAA
jgi:NADPH:quinone reductase-like Zn-dependent oxidoreductase